MSELSKILDANFGYWENISLDKKRGDIIASNNPAELPPLKVVDNHVEPIESMSIQVIKLNDPDTGETAYMRRVVGIMKNGSEFDILDPVSEDSDLTETGLDTSTCDACGLPLDGVDLVVHKGQAFHKYCMVGD